MDEGHVELLKRGIVERPRGEEGLDLQTLLAVLESSDDFIGVATIDITGVPIVDTQVANALVKAAKAVKLLGAQVVITGIRPEVAQTIVALGVELHGITTRRTLQSGIAFAMRGEA
jgi:rsbT co-antagonist protein RsbR